jgi:hypothetical protein
MGSVTGGRAGELLVNLLTGLISDWLGCGCDVVMMLIHLSEPLVGT